MAPRRNVCRIDNCEVYRQKAYGNQYVFSIEAPKPLLSWAGIVKHEAGKF